MNTDKTRIAPRLRCSLGRAKVKEARFNDTPAEFEVWSDEEV
jgi:hypothetical protein